MAVEIRKEKTADAAGIRAVHDAAFGQPGEGRLVDLLRENGGLVLSLVAASADAILGQVSYSPVRVEGAGDPWEALGLGPIGVLPAHQGRGIGSRLVRDSLDLLRDLGHEVVVLVGEPAWYSRFGFRNAAPEGLRLDFEVPQGAFQFLELSRGALRGRKGTVSYREEFAVVGE